MKLVGTLLGYRWHLTDFILPFEQSPHEDKLSKTVGHRSANYYLAHCTLFFFSRKHFSRFLSFFSILLKMSWVKKISFSAISLAFLTINNYCILQKMTRDIEKYGCNTLFLLRIFNFIIDTFHREHKISYQPQNYGLSPGDICACV